MPSPQVLAQPVVLDALIIGLGFSGTFLLHALLTSEHGRGGGLRVLAVDPNDQPGGVWNHNGYPGARVDVSVPSYQLAIAELHEREPWEWSERFPGRDELRAYFRWAHDRLGLGASCEFGVWVERCVWRDEEAVWEVTARDGRRWRTRWLLPCLGYAAAPCVPAWPGADSFRGTSVHSGRWPPRGLALEGKRVGVVGTGATGVQVVQSIAPHVEHLTVLQRTPATALPMQQRGLEPGELTKSPLADRRAFLEERKARWDGSPSSIIMRSAKEDTPEQREAEFKRLWHEGGFAFWTSNYMDLFVDAESNALVYDFWKRTVRSRILDPKMQELLAPDAQPYAFGTKRVPLEQGYYEAFNRDNVSLVDLRSNPIAEIQSAGITLASGALIELDVLIVATGFDISVGSFTQIDIRGVGGQRLAEKWAERPRSYLGLSVAGFPNMLFSYGPHSPSNTCNGPVCAEVQGNWISEFLDHAWASDKRRWEPTEAAEEVYTDLVTGLLKGTLFEGTKAYYHRDNVEHAGKREPIFWMGGLPAYTQKLNECTEAGYAGFHAS